MKICNSCKLEKELSEFHKHFQRVDGHVGKCKSCAREASVRWNSENAARKAQTNKLHYEDNKEIYISRADAWNKNNPEKRQKIKRKYITSGRANINVAKRHAKKLQAIPKWANLDEIKTIYLQCPTGYHVDHIIPLQGKNVCGLHVETNLQYLLAKENISKGNKLLKEYT